VAAAARGKSAWRPRLRQPPTPLNPLPRRRHPASAAPTTQDINPSLMGAVPPSPYGEADKVCYQRGKTYEVRSSASASCGRCASCWACAASHRSAASKAAAAQQLKRTSSRAVCNASSRRRCYSSCWVARRVVDATEGPLKPPFAFLVTRLLFIPPAPPCPALRCRLMASQAPLQW
jgi:hypothetical protein